MQAHFRTKVHKRRLKALELEPYSIEESNRAAGHGNFKKAEKRIMETQPSKAEQAKGKKVIVEKVSEIDTEMKEESEWANAFFFGGILWTMKTGEIGRWMEKRVFRWFKIG